ncbi:MAG: NAD(FAD)-utilizing dehydrogenase [Myxococcaceae bacterium]|nr:NAD(FAD)-utilizing dehydrogenase [Myxococcaceae bacterium]
MSETGLEFEEVEVDLGLDEPDDPGFVRGLVAARLAVPVECLPELELKKKAIDARGGRVRFHLTLARRDAEPARPMAEPPPREVDREARVIIVGDGPAGLFCAYELARQGIGSIVLDRGKEVQPRRRDLKGLTQHGRVDPDSNYCFGEGGAGTYSDGKLYTRSHKRGDVRDVLELLHSHGAPADILVDARPHIGSNKLPKVITALRARLTELGVQFRFDARVTGLVRGSTGAVRAVKLADGSEIFGQSVVLATGHSARDIYELLDDVGVRLISKGFALGVRIEHPQALINRIQYGRAADHPKLPNAAYRVAYTEDSRGVFSFCMCPGGFIVPAATETDGLVVNGMSLSRRDSPYANSGLVVSVEPQDLERAGHRGPLGGIAYQRAIERAAKLAGGGTLRAPATRASDFLRGRASSSAPETSYQPGLFPTDLSEVLDSGNIPLSAQLMRALKLFDKRMRGYASEDAVLVGVESRTSSPVRVPRDAASLQSPDMAGLYPTGEGAGYAGGIVSAALDGMRVARAISSVLTRV